MLVQPSAAPPRRRVAFALSGGANLGPMQAGTVLALTEAGIQPDLMVGTSVGALNAAFLSTRPGVAGAQDLLETWAALRRREAFRFNVLTAAAGFLGLHDHLLSIRQFRRLIRLWLQIERIERATVPLAVTATDALTGEATVLTSGDAVDALAASAAIPGLFPPVRIDGRWLLDGSLSAARPVLQAQALGADDVYVITTATAPRPRPPRGAIAAAMNSVALVTGRAAQAQLDAAIRQADVTGGRVLIVPTAHQVAPGPFDFGESATMATAAYETTRTWLVGGAATITGADQADDRRPAAARHADATGRDQRTPLEALGPEMA
jgi:NTE family protein